MHVSQFYSRQYVFIECTQRSVIDEDVPRSLTRDATHNLSLVSLEEHVPPPPFLNTHQDLDLDLSSAQLAALRNKQALSRVDKRYI